MQLSELICNNTNVSDLSPLAAVPLVTLRIMDTTVSDLSPLHSCSALESVVANRTKITTTEVADLQKALPSCKIEWDDPAKATTPAPAPSDTK